MLCARWCIVGDVYVAVLAKVFLVRNPVFAHNFRSIVVAEYTDEYSCSRLVLFAMGALGRIRMSPGPQLQAPTAISG